MTITGIRFWDLKADAEDSARTVFTCYSKLPSDELEYYGLAAFTILTDNIYDQDILARMKDIYLAIFIETYNQLQGNKKENNGHNSMSGDSESKE